MQLEALQENMLYCVKVAQSARLLEINSWYYFAFVQRRHLYKII